MVIRKKDSDIASLVILCDYYYIDDEYVTTNANVQYCHF